MEANPEKFCFQSDAFVTYLLLGLHSSGLSVFLSRDAISLLYILFLAPFLSLFSLAPSPGSSFISSPVCLELNFYLNTKFSRNFCVDTFFVLLSPAGFSVLWVHTQLSFSY